MKSLGHRLHRAAERAAAIERRTPKAEEPATAKWLKVIKIYLAHLEKHEPFAELDVGAARLRKSVAFLDKYTATPDTTFAGYPVDGYWAAHLEYFCQNCVHMLSWGQSPEWEDRNTLAFLEDFYDERMDGLVKYISSNLLNPSPVSPTFSVSSPSTSGLTS